MSKPRILSTSTLARSRLFRLEAIDLLFSNGNKGTFECVRTAGQGVVMVAAITDQDELLMVREYAACAHIYELGFVKGKIDPCESPLETAARELQEEVGYAAADIEFVRKVSLSPAYTDFETHLYKATNLSRSYAQGDEIEPLEQIRWPLDNIAELFDNPEVNDARVLALLGQIEKCYLAR